MFLTISLRNIGFLLSIVLLSACGDTLEKSTPTDWEPDSTEPEESTGELNDLAKSGQVIYSSDGLNCVSCHGSQGQNSILPIDATRDSYGTNNLTMSEYIATEMIGVHSAVCTEEDCADKLAAYILSWADDSSSETPEEPLELSEQIKLGEALYQEIGLSCLSCHGEEGKGSIYPIDSTLSSYSHSSEPNVSLTLSDYITKWMPVGDDKPETCIGDCADYIAAYIQSWEVPEEVVNLSPVAVATVDLALGDIPLTVTFDGSASTDNEDSTLVYAWDFGDGTTSNAVSPSKTFNNAGNYNVTLTVTDSENASTTAEVINITATSPEIDLPPVAKITKDATTGEIPLTVNFNASTSSDDNNIDSYSWNFGDGSATETGLTASHTYNEVGVYTATLTVTDDAGQSSDSTTQITVQAVVDLEPVAAFTINATTGEAPFAASFDASTSSDDNGITSYSWNYGNGAAISYGQSSSYTFTEAGIYTITLTVSDSSNQTDTVTKTITVTSTEETTPDTGDTDELIALGQTYYEQASLNCVLCHGATGEGGISKSLDASKVTYNVTGIDLTLSDYITQYMPQGGVDNCIGECAESIAAYMRSWIAEEVPVNVPPVAVATADLTSGDVPFTVTFDASTSTDNEDTTLTYSWSFSDGTSSNSATPTKTFNTAGNYSATLTVTDSDNASTTANTINITARSPEVDLPPIAIFTKDVSSGEVPLNVNFDATNSSDDNNIDSYSWDFGDGSATDSGLTVSHTYNEVGVYTATLTVTDDAGQSTDTTTQITVEAMVDLQPVAAFTIATTTGEAPFTTSFDASESSDDNGITSYSWDFGSSAAIVSGVTASHTFTEVGVHTITLTVTDNNDQSNSVTQSITVTATPDEGTDPEDGSGNEELVGNVATGEQLYTSLACIGCHGETGTATSFLFPDIDPDKTIYTDPDDLTETYNLADYIQRYMPDGTTIENPICDAQCSADIASFIATWESNEDTTDGEFSYTCEADAISYGRRQMRLLTSREYENTLQDLLGYTVDATDAGIPTDTLVEGFANQTLTSVTQDYMDAYTSTAAAAASYSAANGFEGVADCTDSSLSECAELFIDGFAFKAYRRPLTDEEADRYRAMFTGSLSESSTSNALQIAIQSVISSPYFLYRSEMGRSIADIEYSNENREGDLVPGSDSYTLSGSDLSSALNSTDVDGFSEFGLHTYKGFNLSGYTFTGSEIVTVVAKGEEANGSLPTLYLKVGDYVSRQQLSSTNETSYTFLLSGDDAVTGSNPYVQFANVPNDVNNEQGGTLSIQSISVANAVIALEPIIELDESLDEDAYVLTSYEVATFIAYTYTGSTPDSTLLQAAKDNELSTPAEIQVHIERLMATDKARLHFGEFAAEWLDVDGVISSSKSATLFPTFTQDIREDMAQEVREIFMNVMFDDNQDVKNIYGNFSFMNKSLADFYGVSGPTSDEFVKVENLVGRGGVLTSGAFMANYAHDEETSPIKRGVAVRENMLCQEVPPMPTNITAEREAAQLALTTYLEENDSLITNAEYYGFITKDAPCSTCHEAIINPHAFGMENFDPVGLLREYGTNGKIIDATGSLVGTETLTDGNVIDFHGARGLSEEIQNLSAAKACFTQKSFRFVMAIGHEVYDSDSDDSPVLSDDEKSDYHCAIEQMSNNMSSNNNNAKAAFEAIGLSDIVLYRKQQ
ncbi:PKD domain-containing protein [Psychromonas sp.]|nr:PKD domain-containing protein [Psychromonas sp.]